MFAQFKNVSLIATLATISLTLSGQADAQCSRGGRGGTGGGGLTTALTSANINPLVAMTGSNNVLAYQRQLASQQQQMLALRQQTMRQQQQLYALWQQQRQQLARGQAGPQSGLQASRLARAEAKRANRAERIAALKAEREGLRDPAVSASTLVSARTDNPFE